MKIYNWLIIILWAVFILYWLVSAVSKKKVIKRPGGIWGFGGGYFGVIVAVIIFQIPSFRRPLFAPNSWALPVGTFLVALGIGLAIWARRHLGRNWNGAPSVQQDHELVTSGPYKYVRHPIYTGILAAVLGSVLASSLGWLMVFIIITIIFIGRIHTEEKFMMDLFPGEYPAYTKRTKALVPFVW